jgi:hypothetical protein
MEHQICAKIAPETLVLRGRQVTLSGIGQQLLFWREYCTCTFYSPQVVETRTKPLFLNIIACLSILREILPKTLDHVFTLSQPV